MKFVNLQVLIGLQMSLRIFFFNNQNQFSFFLVFLVYLIKLMVKINPSNNECCVQIIRSVFRLIRPAVADLWFL